MKDIVRPEKFAEKIYEKLTRSDKAAFIGAVLMGVLTHLYVFTNKQYNIDELAQTPGGIGNGIELNRWFLELMGKAASRYMGGAYSLPLWNGMLTILLLSVSALLVVHTIHCQNAVFAFCIGGLMTAFPSIVCMFFFMFTAAYYAVGIFLSVLSAFIVVQYHRKVWAYFAAVVLLACAMGTYQAFMTNTVCLLLIFLILQCTDIEKSWKEVLLMAVKCLAVLILGLLGYFGVNRFFVYLWQPTGFMSSYQGMGAMGQITLTDVTGGIQKAYQDFYRLTCEDVYSLTPFALQMKGYKIIILALIVTMAAFLVLRKDSWQKKILLLLFVACFPVGMFLVYIMAPDAFYYALMIYAVVFLIVLFLTWMERIGGELQEKKFLAGLLEWGSTAVTVLLLFFYVWFGNGNYMAMDYTKMHDLAYLQTLVTQIKSLEGYSDELPLAVIGREYEDLTNNAGDMFNGTFDMIGRDDINVGGENRMHIITKYLGFTPEICGYEEITSLMEMQEVKDMPCYPDDGSIRIMDGRIIVKMFDY